MAKKLTITISDELHERLEKWRGEINLSRIFQNALSAHVKKKEAFQIKLEEQKTYKEIWDGGDLETIEGLFEVGKELGFTWAKSAPYRGIKRFEKYEERWNEQDSEVIRQFHQEVNFLALLDQFDLVAKDQFPPTEDEPLYILSSSFDLGFLTGIVEFIREECSVLSGRVSLKLREEIYTAKDENGRIMIFRG